MHWLTRLSSSLTSVFCVTQGLVTTHQRKHRVRLPILFGPSISPFESRKVGRSATGWPLQTGRSRLKLSNLTATVERCPPTWSGFHFRLPHQPWKICSGGCHRPLVYRTTWSKLALRLDGQGFEYWRSSQPHPKLGPSLEIPVGYVGQRGATRSYKTLDGASRIVRKLRTTFLRVKVPRHRDSPCTSRRRRFFPVGF